MYSTEDAININLTIQCIHIYSMDNDIRVKWVNTDDAFEHLFRSVNCFFKHNCTSFCREHISFIYKYTYNLASTPFSYTLYIKNPIQKWHSVVFHIILYSYICIFRYNSTVYLWRMLWAFGHGYWHSFGVPFKFKSSSNRVSKVYKWDFLYTHLKQRAPNFSC